MSNLSEQITKLEEENETLKTENEELKEELNTTEVEESLTSKLPFKVGEKYFIRTVTYHMTGKVKKISGGFLVLDDASWIADSGRFNEAINEGKLNEVEPVDVLVFLNISSITDAFEWRHALPCDVK